MNLENVKKSAKEINVSSTSHGKASYPSLSIVNSANNGKRMSFSKGLIEGLGNPKQIQFLTSKTDDDWVLIIGENLKAKDTFKFSPANPQVIYCGTYIQSITAEFKLDFKNRTSMTFSDIEINEYDGKPAAYVNMKK